MVRVTLVVLLLAGCKSPAPEGSALLSQVKQALAERDARLGSYHLAGVTTEGAEQVTYEFFFRGPNKMRAAMLTPQRFAWSFDGQRLVRAIDATKKFETFELKLPDDKAKLFLHATFSPFVLEGFRAPLMPLKGVTAARQGPDAVALRLEPGDGVTVTYVLRWPGADFLERRASSDGGTDLLKIEEELCDAALKLCVPRLAVEYVDGQKRVATRLTAIELNVELPADGFAPVAPDGWTRETRSVVEEN